MAAAGIKATQAAFIVVTGPPAAAGVNATQAAFIAPMGGSPSPLIVTQAAMIVLMQLRPFYPTPPAIKLPCQTTCLQLFDLRKGN